MPDASIPAAVSPSGAAVGSPAENSKSVPPSDPAVYRADSSMPAAAVAQRPAYGVDPALNSASGYQRNDPSVYLPESPAGYGVSTDANGAARGPYPAGYQGPYPANPSNGYPPAAGGSPAAGYGTGAAVYGPEAAGGYADQGAARLNGVIEKPTAGSSYDSTRPGLY
jgi:hypothetical protein